MIENKKDFGISSMMKLEKPLCFFDLETTGIDVKTARIVEINIQKVNLDGSVEEFDSLVNPMMPIPKESSDVHNIVTEMVINAPCFADIVDTVLQFIKGCDLAGFNSNDYDVKVLNNEILRAGKIFNHLEYNLIDVYKILIRNDKRDLSSTYKRYTGKNIESAHQAKSDVLATMEIFAKQLAVHDIPRDNENLSLYCNNDNERMDMDGFFKRAKDGKIYFAKGKHLGQLCNSEPSYLFWILKQDSINEDTKYIANQIINGSMK